MNEDDSMGENGPMKDKKSNEENQSVFSGYTFTQSLMIGYKWRELNYRLVLNKVMMLIRKIIYLIVVYKNHYSSITTAHSENVLLE